MSYLITLIKEIFSVWFGSKQATEVSLGESDEKVKELQSTVKQAEHANQVSQKIDLETNDAVNADLSKWVRPEN